MSVVKTRSSSRKTAINLRVQADTLELIGRAAEVAGKNRTQFVLDAARREAEEVLLDQRMFTLSAAEYDAFMAALDRPPVFDPELRRWLTKAAPWE